MLEPFEINQQLTNDRIDAVGQLLVEAHNEASSVKVVGT
tara:strand:- start:16 stop:132 length:117 start_codon:yes stop_codon:yes gene_type:complete